MSCGCCSGVDTISRENVNFLKKVPYTAFDVLSPVRIPHLQPALLVHL